MNSCIHGPEEENLDLCEFCDLPTDTGWSRWELLREREAHEIVGIYAECSGCYFCTWSGHFCTCVKSELPGVEA